MSATMIEATGLLEAAAYLNAYADALPLAETAIVQAVGETILASTRQTMEEMIYDRPLPESMAIRGMIRTGALLAGEQLIHGDDEEGGLDLDSMVVTTVNEPGFIQPATGEEQMAEEYAEYRHDEGGIHVGPAPWRVYGLEHVLPELQGVAELTAEKVLP